LTPDPNQLLHQTGHAKSGCFSLTPVPREPAGELQRSGATRGCRGNCVALREEVTTPTVLPVVSYRGMRPWQRGGMKPSAERILIRKDGNQSVSGGCDCQHQGGRGPGGVVGSTQVNRCKRRHKEQAQGAVGLDQKVRGQVRVLRTHPAQLSSHRRRGGT